MKKLLLTGFEPFLNYSINPTEEIVKALHGLQIGEYEIIGKTLPVDYKESERLILQAIEDVNPDVVVSLGLAAGRFKITPERIAINVKDGDRDNSGHVVVDETINERGEDGYFTTLPVRKMVTTLKEKQFPAEISNSAGTYLCNNVMYASLHHFAQLSNKRAGFIHIPASHQLAIAHGNLPSWSQQDLTDAIKICIEVL